MASQVPCDMVAAVEFYGDESGDPSDPQCNVLVLAGFAAAANDWKNFSDLWDQYILKEHKVPYIHMREFHHFVGPFERFKNDRPATESLLQDIATVIRVSGLRGAGAALILSELAKYNSANSLALDPYGLCLYVTFGNLNAGYMNARRHLPLHMIFDRAPHGHSRAEVFLELLETDRLFQQQQKSGLVDVPVVIPLPHKSTDSRRIPALQAADFAAWEFRKAIDLKMKWFLNVKPHLPDQLQATIHKSMIEYQAREKNIAEVTAENYWTTRERRSFANLLMHGITSYRVMDFHTLGILAGYRNSDWPRKT
jgi:hypothetical protein